MEQEGKIRRGMIGEIPYLKESWHSRGKEADADPVLWYRAMQGFRLCDSHHNDASNVDYRITSTTSEAV